MRVSAAAVSLRCSLLLLCADPLLTQPELCVAYLPNLDEVSSTHLEPKLPLEALTPVLPQLEPGCMRLAFRCTQRACDANDCSLAAWRVALSLALSPYSCFPLVTLLLPLAARPQVMESAIEGCKEIYKLLQAIVLEECSALAAAKGRVSL